MQVDHTTEPNKDLSQYLTDRQKKALLARTQQSIFNRQATFDGFGLARPKKPCYVTDPPEENCQVPE